MTTFDEITLVGFDEETSHNYRRSACAVFRKTNERWGGFSNMAAGFPIVVNDVPIRTSEAIYQACRFPHLPSVQREIIAQASPMAAKMKGKPHRQFSRPDFDGLRVPLMWWSIRVKLACNMPSFSRLLLATNGRTVVEESVKDIYWGAKASSDDDRKLVGRNVLGRLLCLLREAVEQKDLDTMMVVPPLPITDFLLFGVPIRTVEPIGQAAHQQATRGPIASSIERQFICTSCHLVQHLSRLAVSEGRERICSDCAI